MKNKKNILQKIDSFSRLKTQKNEAELGRRMDVCRRLVLIYFHCDGVS